MALIGSLVQTQRKSQRVAIATRAKIKQPSRQQWQLQLARTNTHMHKRTTPSGLAPRNRHKMSSILDRRGRNEGSGRETSRQSGRGGEERCPGITPGSSARCSKEDIFSSISDWQETRLSLSLSFAHVGVYAHMYGHTTQVRLTLAGCASSS